MIDDASEYGEKWIGKAGSELSYSLKDKALSFSLCVSEARIVGLMPVRVKQCVERRKTNQCACTSQLEG